MVAREYDNNMTFGMRFSAFIANAHAHKRRPAWCEREAILSKYSAGEGTRAAPYKRSLSQPVLLM